MPTTTDDGLELLTGADAADLLTAAIEPAGGRLLHWSLRDVDHRPSDRTTVSYNATVAWPDGERVETLGASTSTGTPPPGPVVTDGDRHVQVWRFPFDPELPGLPGVTFDSTVRELLRSMGHDPEGLQVRVVAYRPRKRAVVEVRFGAGTQRMFLKVLRPRAVADVEYRHRLLAEAGVPVPRVLGTSADGVIALEALTGTSLGSLLMGPHPVPVSADDLLSVLDLFPAQVAELPRRRAWSAHAVHYAGVVASAYPQVSARVHDVAGRIEAAIADDPDGDEPTHGDFYEAQLLVADGAVTGLLDIDTIGPGRRADDLACLLAHLSITAREPAAAAARSALTQWTQRFELQVDRRELYARTAGVLMSLATGPYRAQEPGWQAATVERIELAEQWLGAGSTRI